ncbi:unnamed protein product [Ilex paraguariensis]|uniref:Uncharacterized protein n=1 Tax=Ilex paraguariensis TaxID=185542 RepID=A0ABC8RAH5_9AQUA
MEVDSQTNQGNADDNAASSNGEPPSPIVISSGDDTSESDDFDEVIGPEFTEFSVPVDITTNNEDEDNQHGEIPTGLKDDVLPFEFLNTDPQDMFFSSEYDYPTFGPYLFDGIEGMPQEENNVDLPPPGMESVLELQDSLAIPMIPVPPSSTLDSNNLSYEQFLHAGDYQGGPSGDWDIFSGDKTYLLNSH